MLEFEEWLYADKRLELILSTDDYLDLISYGYKVENAKYGLYRLLEKHIDKGELETKRIYNLLTKALNKDRELPEILMTFYDLYCRGYNFFDSLGLGYGLRVEVPGINNLQETWGELTEAEQASLINSFYPDLDVEIKRVISWLDTGKVVLTGIKNEYNHLDYVDNRTELEKQPTGFQVVKGDFKVSKPWWRFW